MFLVHYEANIVYAVFQDLSWESGKDISKHISKKLQDKDVPISIHKRIKDFFADNKVIESNFPRQKAYISKLETYIDVISDKKKDNTYRLNLYILPKDIHISYNKDEDARTTINKVEKLSLHIFKLYDSLQPKSDEKLKLLKTFKGRTFLDLELEFYLHELNRLYDHLLTYSMSLKDKVICSDKEVGILIDDLNQLEGNPLKRYQFVKVPHQKDLIRFIYSLITFLEDERIKHFKDNYSYKNIKNIISKINNYLLKISTSSHVTKEPITFKSLSKFFNRYKNSKEIQKNQLIYNILESIFFNQLKEGVFISKSIDMTKMFEQVVENSLSATYKDNLFVGEEPKKITGKNEEAVKHLNKINHLLKSSSADEELGKEHIGQFPDFLIKKSGIYHVVDAKYKLKNYLIKDRAMFWQVLIYSKLFNKNISDQNSIKKIIIFAEKSDINLDNINQITVNNTEAIDIKKCDWEYDEMAFESKIGFIGMRTLRN